MNLKDEYNKIFVKGLAQNIAKYDNKFDSTSFIENIINKNWEKKELKERMRFITETINAYLKHPYPNQIKILSKVVSCYSGLQGMLFPDFVQVYGLNDYKISINALELFTQHSTAEFAIRPFIEKYPNKTMNQMLEWSKHKNEHLRRLASEGCRPKLPWASPLREFINNPTPCLPILENLKADESLYVKKSVANHLNDISKNHPKLVLDTAKKWHGKNLHTDWIIKHALRTLLKKGDKNALSIFGLNDSKNLEINSLNVSKSNLSIGEFLFFEFDVINQSPKQRAIRLEYKIDYVKANGRTSGKVFQISEFTLSANTSKQFKRKQWFKQLSTRVHHPGKHKITIIVNGEKKDNITLDLKP